MNIPNKTIIFIGTGRSGTTIITELVSRHPDLAYLSNYQDKFPRFQIVNRIRLLFDNKFYRIFGQKKQINKVSYFNSIIFRPTEGYNIWKYLLGPGIDFSRGFLLKTQIDKENLVKIRLYFARIVELQRRKRLVIKITGPSRINFLLQVFPDAIFINLQRDLIPTIHSFLRTKFWKTRGYENLWWTGAYSQEELLLSIVFLTTQNYLRPFNCEKLGK